jgi:predicted transcriptional regulator
MTIGLKIRRMMTEEEIRKEAAKHYKITKEVADIVYKDLMKQFLERKKAKKS